MLPGILAALAALSLVIGLWQFIAALRFPLHRRHTPLVAPPAVTLLKPLKGCDAETAACLTSWLAQDYPAPVQILFGVASPSDPVCDLVRELLTRFPRADAQLVICGERLGANAKVSSLVQLERLARHPVLVVSDADVRVPADFLAQAVRPLAEPTVGLVNCFYRLANPTNLAMHWEAVAVNADFWSQVTQSLTLQPMNFALGAVMLTRREQLNEIGCFTAFVNHLADDYQLGNRIARRGHHLAICPVVVECWSGPMTASEVWSHQLRWARTIRVCQPVPYFFSILSNASWWAVLFFLSVVTDFRELTTWYCGLGELGFKHPLAPLVVMSGFALPSFALVLRIGMARDTIRWIKQSLFYSPWAMLAPFKDLLQVPIWALAFLGNTVVWRGQRLRVLPGGKLVSVRPPPSASA